MQLIEGPNDQDAAPEEMPAQANSDDTLIGLWLAGKADRTRRAYQDDVAALLRFVGKPLRQVTLADLVAWGETLNELEIGACEPRPETRGGEIVGRLRAPDRLSGLRYRRTAAAPGCEDDLGGADS
jgi:hypothetical protein